MSVEHIVLSNKIFQIDEWDKICNRCGECCKLYDFTKEPPEEKNEYCPHLKRYKNGKTKCKIYPNRYGTKLKYGGECVPVEGIYKRAKNCPYNHYLNTFMVFRAIVEKSDI